MLFEQCDNRTLYKTKRFRLSPENQSLSDKQVRDESVFQFGVRKAGQVISTIYPTTQRMCVATIFHFVV